MMPKSPISGDTGTRWPPNSTSRLGGAGRGRNLSVSFLVDGKSVPAGVCVGACACVCAHVCVCGLRDACGSCRERPRTRGPCIPCPPSGVLQCAPGSFVQEPQGSSLKTPASNPRSAGRKARRPAGTGGGPLWAWPIRSLRLGHVLAAPVPKSQLRAEQWLPAPAFYTVRNGSPADMLWSGGDLGDLQGP